MIYKKIYTFFFVSILLVTCNAVFSMNLTTLYDTLLVPERRKDSRFQFYLIAQSGFDTKSFDCNQSVSNVLNIWNKDQNAIKMLDGFASNTDIGQLRTRIDANDDNVRGHFLVCGDLDVDFAGEFSSALFFKDQFSLSFHLPFYSMKLENVCWQEQTNQVSRDDFRVKEYLTNDFFNNVKRLGCLDLCGWKRRGLGDALLLFRWQRDFEQAKQFLKNVRLGARVGLSLPTGKKVDEDKIFAFSFGNDGATGALVGGAIDLTFGRYFKAGLDVQLHHLFGNTKCRRIKTDFCQTELLLLKKVDAYKEFALMQRFNLYLEIFKFLRGLSFKVGYQFRRRGDDILYLCSQDFSDEIANTAESLQEWTMHTAVFNLSYDFWNSDAQDEHRVHPYISIFAKVPFNGMRVAMARTAGVALSIDF